MSHDLPPNLRQEQHLQVGDVTVDGQGHYLDFEVDPPNWTVI